MTSTPSSHAAVFTIGHAAVRKYIALASLILLGLALMIQLNVGPQTHGRLVEAIEQGYGHSY